jgi:hypothetical protein
MSGAALTGGAHGLAQEIFDAEAENAGDGRNQPVELFSQAIIR